MLKSLRVIGEYAVGAACAILFLLSVACIAWLQISGTGLGKRDFISYWAAAHQVAAHRNPYRSEEIERIERANGLGDVREIIMRNPPYALASVLPLALFQPRPGFIAWSLLLLACLVASVRMVWTLHGRPRDHLALLGYSFAPALGCILLGQTSLFALLGLVLFLRLHPHRPALAGACLWLCALKPHLFLPFAAVLLLWIVLTRSYAILAGAAAALAASCAVVYLLDPSAWPQYNHLMQTWGIQQEYIPCLSIALRFALRPGAIWLQYLPTALACAWALVYFFRNRTTWNWLEHGSLLMLVSVAAAPYSWFTDQAVLIPAILAAVYLTRSRAAIALLALGSAAIELAVFYHQSMHSTLFLWTAPAWLVWYLYATRPRRIHPLPALDQGTPTLEVLT
jgi:hypothetical protein